MTHRYKTLLRTACCTATMVDGGSALVVGGSFLSLRASSREGNSVRMERVGGERVEMDANGVVHLHFCHFPLPPPKKKQHNFFFERLTNIATANQSSWKDTQKQTGKKASRPSKQKHTTEHCVFKNACDACKLYHCCFS